MGAVLTFGGGLVDEEVPLAATEVVSWTRFWVFVVDCRDPAVVDTSGRDATPSILMVFGSVDKLDAVSLVA